MQQDDDADQYLDKALQDGDKQKLEEFLVKYSDKKDNKKIESAIDAAITRLIKDKDSWGVTELSQFDVSDVCFVVDANINSKILDQLHEMAINENNLDGKIMMTIRLKGNKTISDFFRHCKEEFSIRAYGIHVVNDGVDREAELGIELIKK